MTQSRDTWVTRIRDPGPGQPRRRGGHLPHPQRVHRHGGEPDPLQRMVNRRAHASRPLTAKTLARTDAAAAALLLLWAGMVLGFAFLIAPLLFGILPSRDLAGLIAGRVVAGWISPPGSAFLAAAVLVQGARWTPGDPRRRGAGPAAAVGRGRRAGPADVLHQQLHHHPQAAGDPGPHGRPGGSGRHRTIRTGWPTSRAHGISRQLMGLRLLLALALAAGVVALPRRQPD